MAVCEITPRRRTPAWDPAQRWGWGGCWLWALSCCCCCGEGAWQAQLRRRLRGPGLFADPSPACWDRQRQRAAGSCPGRSAQSSRPGGARGQRARSRCNNPALVPWREEAKGASASACCRRETPSSRPQHPAPAGSGERKPRPGERNSRPSPARSPGRRGAGGAGAGRAACLEAPPRAAAWGRSQGAARAECAGSARDRTAKGAASCLGHAAAGRRAKCKKVGESYCPSRSPRRAAACRACDTQHRCSGRRAGLGPPSLRRRRRLSPCFLRAGSHRTPPSP